ncbi:hypothetical protein ACIPYS_04845 [Kitasatospora sp. NPDC089913]|uniref:hypothetical protein n=1 Tax=Kitasatospora sp. NPDC089913 TaxID=3364080 RepID=UPI0038124070
MTRGILVLAPGSAVEVDGVEWTVEVVEPQVGRIVLAGADGSRERRSLRWLVNHPGVRPVLAPGAAPVLSGRQGVALSDLTEEQLIRARIRAKHVLEAEIGFRADTRRGPCRASPDSPTTRRRRRWASGAGPRRPRSRRCPQSRPPRWASGS